MRILGKITNLLAIFGASNPSIAALYLPTPRC